MNTFPNTSNIFILTTSIFITARCRVGIDEYQVLNKITKFDYVPVAHCPWKSRDVTNYKYLPL